MHSKTRNNPVVENDLDFFYKPYPADFPFKLLYTDIVVSKGCERLSRIDYPVCTIEYVLEGQGYVEVNSFSCRPKKNDVYILHKGSRHLYYPEKSNPWKKIFFMVDGLLMEQLLLSYNLSSIYYIPDCNLESLFHQMHCLRADKTFFRHYKAAHLFHQIVMEINIKLYENNLSNTHLDLIINIKNILDNHIEKRLFVGDIAEQLGKTKHHIIRVFKKATGQTPYDYLMKKRIGLAKLLLANTCLMVKEIAYRLQFRDAYHFSNYFKQKVGLSPEKYRQNLLDKPCNVPKTP